MTRIETKVYMYETKIVTKLSIKYYTQFQIKILFWHKDNIINSSTIESHIQYVQYIIPFLLGIDNLELIIIKITKKSNFL